MTERWRDVAHIGHAELLTPAPEASLEYFTTLLGLTVAAEGAGSWYLRGYGDYEPYCLKLTASDHAGLGHLAVRAWSPEALARRVAWLEAAGVPGSWTEPDGGKGPAYEFRDPDGHPVRIYHETSKYAAPAGERPAMKSNHQRYAGRGANVRRLEHVNLMTGHVRACGGERGSTASPSGGAAAVDVPALRHAAGGRARGGGHVGLALAGLTHFPEALARR
jgi:catechol 2,3-dioxygenase